ncbi:hypothetical protein EDD85DRAFT_54833 [Armillaria nabsnona]|nr:hypothetical protein EDD85DRAFT_54833 [Armillaria nabsnona]
MLTLCLIAFFEYYSATINLRECHSFSVVCFMRPRSTDRPFILYPKEVHPTSEASLTKCVSAARRSIMGAAELRKLAEFYIRGLYKILPPSHHLTYAVQQVWFSGVMLIAGSNPSD